VTDVPTPTAKPGAGEPGDRVENEVGHRAGLTEGEHRATDDAGVERLVQPHHALAVGEQRHDDGEAAQR
jgi:hypothetical protein